MSRAGNNPEFISQGTATATATMASACAHNGTSGHLGALSDAVAGLDLCQGAAPLSCSGEHLTVNGMFSLTSAGLDTHNDEAVAVRRRYDEMLPTPVMPKPLSCPQAVLSVFILLGLYAFYGLRRLVWPRSPLPRMPRLW